MVRRKTEPYSKLAQIQYVGLQRASAECKEAVIRLVQMGETITLARILTCESEHCLLLTVGPGDLVAVKSGFASGYAGEGPAAFAYVLLLFDAMEVEIQEFEVSHNMIERLDASTLTNVDLSRLSRRRGVRGRWPDYISERHWALKDTGRLWKEFPTVIPYAIIDRRLIDLAIKFWDEPDARILTAYRRLEDAVRDRASIDEHGSRLFAQAFAGPKARLSWPSLTESERGARAQLFKSVFGAYRNARAHRERREYRDMQLAEFLLINQLFRLEAEAEQLSDTAQPPPMKARSRSNPPAS